MVDGKGEIPDLAFDDAHGVLVIARGAVLETWSEGVVQVVLDRALFSDQPICVHPLVNTQTSSISRDDLIRFLEDTGHPPKIVDLPEAT